MAARNNALSELTRFWLQTRHGCLVNEAIPVKVPHAHSDIDLAALRSDLQSWSLPNGTPIIRAVIETKDEHDFDPDGRDFGKRLRADVKVMGDKVTYGIYWSDTAASDRLLRIREWIRTAPNPL